MDEEGELDEFCLTELEKVPGGLWRRLAALLSESDGKVHIRFMILDKDGNLQPANPGSAENKAVRLLKEEWDNYIRWQDICLAVRRVPELQAILRRPDLPDQHAVELLLRYETAFKRQFYKAMDALERLQRRRLGDFVPPPINAHLRSSSRSGVSLAGSACLSNVLAQRTLWANSLFLPGEKLSPGATIALTAEFTRSFQQPLLPEHARRPYQTRANRILRERMLAESRKRA